LVAGNRQEDFPDRSRGVTIDTVRSGVVSEDVDRAQTKTSNKLGGVFKGTVKRLKALTKSKEA